MDGHGTCPEVEARTLAVGRELFAAVRKLGTGEPLLDRLLMHQGMRDDRVKAELFRFVDVLPALRSDAAVARHLKEYLGPVAGRLPLKSGLGVRWLPADGLLAGAAARAARWGATRMARRFIAATDLPEAVAAVERLRARHLAFTIDLLGEAVVSAAEASQYQQLYLSLVAGLADAAAGWPADSRIDRDDRGPHPPVNVSVKLSSLYSQFDPIDPDGTAAAVCDALRPILRLARARGVFVNVDMEQSAYKDATFRIFKRVFAEPEFRDWPDVGLAVQAYLTSSGDDLRDLATWAAARGTPVWVRLVKGAYWDYETVVAAQNDWPVPVYTDKGQTDANYEQQTTFLMENARLLRPAIATHNIRSIAHAIATAEQVGLAAGAYEFQMLWGMADPIKAALVGRGHRVRVYTPFGKLLPGMAYLVRRLLENTSNESFLKAGFADRKPVEELLMNPMDLVRGRRARAESNGTASGEPRGFAPSSVGTRDVASPTNDVGPGRSPWAPSFKNEPLTDFSREDARRNMRDALDAVAKSFGRSYPLVIAGRRVETGDWIESRNPADRSQVVGRSAAAREVDAVAAVNAAAAAFPDWRDTPVSRRSDLLRRVTGVLRRRRFELAAVMVYEAAKPWREADADVAEAIDFCGYYAAEMERLDRPRHRDVPGEDNQYLYEARGVAVVIAPWNFPLAILCGMTAAAVVAGNPVVMKPAEQSPVVAAMLMEAFEEAGAPAGVVNYLPGVGETVGPVLVGHKDTSVIAFTGSRAVGLAIQRQAAEVADGQEHIKRVIAELGGKNAVIVDDDADLDEAVLGVVAGAFGYAGQKCSAGSRAIVLAGVYDAFVARLVEATRSLKVGPPIDPGNAVGPVIDDEAQQRILAAIEKGKGEATLAYQADVDALTGRGSYVPPTIFMDVSPSAVLAQEEVFGPVLAVLRAADLTEALRVANGTKYALTGGVYSRSPANIDRVKREFRVGNLYVNRKVTGALVDRQPFGGFKLSGVGSKAGGPDYLLQFLNPRTITENTLRRGFAPEVAGDGA
jgi:RHH-type proline utilization regulon transcriptional repressor/proline dehydrogenase/delta 1-pyrroline-5-carboxylate dehydrogenase